MGDCRVSATIYLNFLFTIQWRITKLDRFVLFHPKKNRLFYLFFNFSAIFYFSAIFSSRSRLRHLAKETKCFTLFATHFHEITDLSTTLNTVQNSHMVAVSDEDTFTLLYQVSFGVMDKSFGIHVAKLANFPHEVVELAQKTFDECDDHWAQLRSTRNGKKSAQMFDDAIDIMTKFDPETVSDDEITEAIKSIRAMVKKSNNAYLIYYWPQLFK